MPDRLPTTRRDLPGVIRGVSRKVAKAGRPTSTVVIGEYVLEAREGQGLTIRHAPTGVTTQLVAPPTTEETT